MLVIGYVRVSSMEQEHGYGPEVQEAGIRDYCAERELGEVEIVHESKSGESIVARQELQQVISRARASQDSGVPAHIVFYKLDRLSRDLLDQESVVSMALRHGFRLHSTQPSEADTLDPAYAGDPMRTAIRQFFGIFAQLERATIQARLDSGLHAKAKTGKSTGGRLPFGYQALGQDIVIQPENAPIVVRVFQLHQAGLDLAGIIAVVAREFPEKCSRWNKSTVSRMLRRRDVYAFGRYKTRMGVNATDRAELIILPTTDLEKPKPLPDLKGPVNWENVPDPVPILALSLMVGRTAPWIQRVITERGLEVRWNKGRQLVPLDSARQIEQVSNESKHSP